MFKEHLKRKDLLSAELILEELNLLGVDNETMETDLELRKIEEQQLLKEVLKETRNQVEQATIDHVLSEEQRAEFDGALLSNEEQSSKRPFRFHAELKGIQQKIDRLRKERQDSLKENVNQICLELEQSKPDVPKDRYDKAVDYIDKARGALENGDLPLADEYLRFAEIAFDTGIEADWENNAVMGNPVREFIGVMKQLNQLLEKNHNNSVIETLSRGKSVAGMNMDVPGARQKEIKKGLKAWSTLKGLSKNPNISNQTHIQLEVFWSIWDFKGLWFNGRIMTVSLRILQ